MDESLIWATAERLAVWLTPFLPQQQEQTYPEMSVADLHLPSTLIAGDLLRDKSPNNKVTPTGSDWPVYEIWMSSTPSDHWKDFRRTSRLDSGFIDDPDGLDLSDDQSVDLRKVSSEDNSSLSQVSIDSSEFEELFKPIWSPYLTTNDWTEALNQLKQTNELSGQSSSKSNSLASLALEQDDVFEEFRKELISSKPPSKRQISSDYICHACGVKTHLIEDCPNKSVDKGYKGPKPCVNFYKCSQACCRHEFFKLISVCDDTQNCNKRGCCASDIVAQYDLMNLPKEKEVEVVKKICRLRLQKPSNWSKLTESEKQMWSSKPQMIPDWLIETAEQDILEAKRVVFSFYEIFNHYRRRLTLEQITEFNFSLHITLEQQEKIFHLSKLYDIDKVTKLGYVVNPKLLKTFLKNF